MKKVLDVPYISQRLGYCGPACLAMVLNYFDYDINQDNIAEKIGLVEFFGATISDLSKISEEFGFDTKIVNCNLSTIVDSINLNKPIITLQKKNFSEDSMHYRVVIGYDNSTLSIFYHDPEEFKKESLISLHSFFELWKPSKNVALILDNPSHAIKEPSIKS